jgi:nitrogen fixation/metabolism regulation signal transduction histidine kinase
MRHEWRVVVIALAGGAPALVVLALVLAGLLRGPVAVGLGVAVGASWLICGLAIGHVVAFPLRTLGNLLGGLREGDYTVRAAADRHTGLLRELVEQANALGDVFRDQRMEAMSASALLRKVMGQIDVAVFAFDPSQKLRLLNEPAQRLLSQSAQRLIGLPAQELGLAEYLAGPVPRIVDLALPGGAGRWELRRTTFRDKGLPHVLVVLSDLTRTLHEEEREAWSRLVQVIRHEISNTLAPVQSLAGTLRSLLQHAPRTGSWEADLKEGLEVIEERSKALNRFMLSYTQLARLPEPQLRDLDVEAWVRRVASLETRIPVRMDGGPALTIRADGDQLEQLLINLVRNAADAALVTRGQVRVWWSQAGDNLDVWVEDDGPGLPQGSNLFVPFVTTKAGGAGLGLVLCRQIAEAHGGTLALHNRRDKQGCRAHLRLPLALESPSATAR